MKVTKLGVAIVTEGKMEAQTACALISALPNIGVPFQMILAMGCYIHLNREGAVKMAFENQCSHIMFIDTDMFFDQMAIRKLIEHDLDIVGGRYNKRLFPVQSIVKENIADLSKVSFVPTGFLLINMDVFRKIGQPYFSFDNAESEDVYFCEKAKRNGYDIWCDPTIQIGHLGTAMF